MNTVLNTDTISSNDTVAEAQPTLAVVSDAAPTLVDQPERVVDEQTLHACLKLVREQFEANLLDERKAYEKAEESHAELLSLGFGNALDWLSNKPLLIAHLVKVGMTPAKDDVGLLGQIAKLQLGRWKALKDGNPVWSVPNRRDERLGRFYRIFFADPAKFPRDGLKTVILNHPKKSGGILEAAKPKVVKVGKAETHANHVLAREAAPLAQVQSSVRVAKVGEYRLMLVRASSTGFDVCEVIEDQEALTTKFADRYAAEAALTVPAKAE